MEKLLNLYFDQSLTDAECRELQRELLGSAHECGEFWEAARWHALLWQWGAFKLAPAALAAAII